MPEVIAVTDARGAIVRPDLLAAAESVHRQLRPQIPRDYVARMKEVFGSGAEMAVAMAGGAVAGITVFRVVERTVTGRDSGAQREAAHRFYVREGMTINSFHFGMKRRA